MRTVKATAETLTQDRDRGYGKIVDLQNRREVTVIWDDTQEQTLDAVFKLKFRNDGKEVVAVFNKDEFQKLIRWA